MPDWLLRSYDVDEETRKPLYWKHDFGYIGEREDATRYPERTTVLTGTWERADEYVNLWDAVKLASGMILVFATLIYIVLLLSYLALMP